MRLALHTTAWQRNVGSESGGVRLNLARLFRQVWTLTAAARLVRQESNPLMMEDRILLSQIAYLEVRLTISIASLLLVMLS